MAEWRVPLNDILAFMDDDERQHYESPDRTAQEGENTRAELEKVWTNIPDPTESELRQFMSERDWQETQHNPEARSLPKAHWKRFRKANTRAELANRKAEQPPKPQQYEPPPETLHRMEKEHQRTKREQLEKDLGIGSRGSVEIPPSHSGSIADRIFNHTERRELDRREELLRREEELQQRRESDRRQAEMDDDPITRLLDQAAIRERKELVEREERLQRQREEEARRRPKTFDVVRRVSLWPGTDEEHARKMQAAFEKQSETSGSAEEKPYTQPKRVSKVELAKLLRYAAHF